jgi:hypothetical protein|tara:strand:- start:5030 stop:5383 length:354 start_codon:yes stop_codon:yes gene_type:complete
MRGMTRDFIFRSIKRTNKLDYLGYVLNVGSEEELFEAVSELGFSPDAMEYHAVNIGSKAIAICMPFRASAKQMEQPFYFIGDVDNKFFSNETDKRYQDDLKGDTDSGTFPADIFTGP